MNRIIYQDNINTLPKLPDASIPLIYIDPPFNTGRTQSRTSIKTHSVASGGDRVGYKGKQYKSERLSSSDYADIFDDYLDFLRPRIEHIYRVLAPYGSLFFHIDYRESHYCKILLDSIFGCDSFMNEIIWAYDFGARSKSRWSTKHDTIFWYAKDPKSYTYRFNDIDRIPYMAPNLVGPEKAAKGKTPTDVWWHTIVSPNGKEKTGYATQKPLGVVGRIVRVHSNPGETVLDCFAGSGTLGDAAGRLGRQFILVDNNLEAIQTMQQRLAPYGPTLENCNDWPTEASDHEPFLI